MAMLSLITARAAAQAADITCDPGDLEVRRLAITGSKTFRGDFLASGIGTTPSSWLRRTFGFLGRAYCLDAFAVRQDSARLSLFYREHGFSEVRIATSIDTLGPGVVAVRFRIEEGPPVLIDSLAIVFLDREREELLDSLPERDWVLRGVPVRLGARFDYDEIRFTQELMTRRLRERGYPEAEVLRSYEPSATPRRVTLEIKAYPGPRARIDSIRVKVRADPGRAPRLQPEKVKKVIGIREGQLYNERSLEGVKRGLYLTEAFRKVEVGVDSNSLRDAVDSLVNIDLTLLEAQSRAARLSVGWGTFDCLRAQGSHTNYNFLGALRRIDLTARVSKVGVDPPFDAARGLCGRDLLNDPLSDTLNYYAGATYSQAALFRLRIIPSLTIYSERRSEFQAFLRTTPLGVIGSLQQGLDGSFPMTWSYQLEYGRTIAQPAFFCAVFDVCEDAARSQLEHMNRTAVVGWSAIRNRANDPVSPTRGSVVRLELRHASPPVGSTSTVQFNRATFDAATYFPVFDGGAFVLRLRGGTVLGSGLSFGGGARFIPLQERLYAGGPSTVRGFRQNELGPAIYIPDSHEIIQLPGTDTLAYFRANPATTSERVVPTGGDNLVVANAELRLRSLLLPVLVQYALFVDAGQVWNRGRRTTGVSYRDLQITPGLGLRVFTDFGPIRVDVGYNPYDRPAGAAYFNPVPIAGSPGQVIRLICVSPGNTLRVRLGDNQHVPQQIDEDECPATYVPASRTTFFSRLTWQFSIGQPF